jgi:hypothetical protein
MNRISLLALLLLGACGQQASSVRITQDAPAPQPTVAPKPTAEARSEPVFYNGKTYRLNFAPDSEGGYAVAIIGMNAGQQKDARAFTSTAFHHFNCKDSQKTKFLASPTFVGGKWQSRTTCA